MGGLDLALEKGSALISGESTDQLADFCLIALGEKVQEAFYDQLTIPLDTSARDGWLRRQPATPTQDIRRQA